MIRAEARQRAMWRSMSGMTPSKARPPSKIMLANQNDWSSGPMTMGLPSWNVPS